MKEGTIVQFVCFITDLDTAAFAPEWQGYIATLKNSKTKTILYEQASSNDTNYRYISKLECPESDFQFSFIKERKSGRFSDSRVRNFQLGGYITTQQQEAYKPTNSDITIIAFIHHNETDISYYQQLSFFSSLNIHQAYYENCMYGYVLEFVVAAKQANALLEQLDKRHGVQVGMYKTSLRNKVRHAAHAV